MRTLLLIVGLLWGTAWAETVIRCRQGAPGFYPNDAEQVRAIDAISYVSHFSLSNFLALRIETSGKPIVFTRETLAADRQAHLRFISKQKNNRFIQAWMHLDRNPRQVIETRAFKGVLFISNARKDKAEYPADLPKKDMSTYNFECSF
ncbi:MAG: hypothetical protein ACLGG0_13140 [Bacteriovoracia bacterium]